MRSDSPPRYIQIFVTLRDRIETGVYPVGDRVPTEAELSEEFSASRYTVREALRRLVASGMVDRRKGSGTQVIAREPRANYVQSMGSLSDLFQYALDTHFEISTVATEALDGADAEDVGVEPGSPWVRIEGVRLSSRGGTPICATTVFVAARFRPLLFDVVGARVPIYSIVESRSGEPIVEAVQEVTARRLPRRMTRQLDVSAGSIALRLLRRYVGADGLPMVVSINWHPADSYTYTMRIERGGLMG